MRRPLTPARFAIRLIFWLAIAAVVNITGTWAISATQFANHYDTFGASTARNWPAEIPNPGPRPEMHFSGSTWCSGFECWSLSGGELRVDMYSWGFPCRSLMFYTVYDQSRKDRVVHGAYILWTKNPPFHAFPMRPLCRGMLINSSAYALAMFLLFNAYPFCRTWLRRRAGRCAACGYDLTGITQGICPECGNAVHSR